MKKTRKQIEEEMATLQKQLEEVEREEAALFAAGPRARIADAIHTATCHQDHAEACGWYYETWQSTSWSRNHYLDKAQRMLEAMEPYGMDENGTADAIVAIFEAFSG